MEYSIIQNYNNKILISISYILINTKFNRDACYKRTRTCGEYF